MVQPKPKDIPEGVCIGLSDIRSYFVSDGRRIGRRTFGGFSALDKDMKK
jgi:hypothetical protein